MKKSNNENKKRGRGRPKGANNTITDDMVAHVQEYVNLTAKEISKHEENGGEIVEIDGHKFPVEGSTGGDFISLSAPKQAGRPTKDRKAFDATNIPNKRKEIVLNIPAKTLKKLRQFSRENPNKQVWLDNGLGYYLNGTLFNRFSMPLSSQEGFDLRVSTIAQNLVIYLIENKEKFLVEDYLNTIGITRDWLEGALKERPELLDTYKIATQICKARLCEMGANSKNAGMFKFLLQAEHGLAERRAVETMSISVKATQEEIEKILKEETPEKTLNRLNELLRDN